jgi:drug/metabolite transporter (DMT)-like permease
VELRRKADLALAGIAAIWGFTFVVVKAALDDCSVVLFLALRFTLAAAVLTLLFARSMRWRSADALGGIVAGLCLMGGYMLQTWGLRLTTASKSGFLTGLYIVLVPLLAAAVYKVVPGWREWLGVLLAFTGMALLTLDGAALSINRGDALTIAGAVMFAIHILVLSYWAKTGEIRALTVAQLGSGAMLCWIAIPFAEPPFVHWTPRLVGALLTTGLIATAFVFVIQTWAQKHTTPSRTALLLSLEPVFAAVAAVAAAGERLTPRAIAGSLLILAGILRVEMKPAPVRPDL